MLQRVMRSNSLTLVSPLSLIGPRNPSLMEALFPSINTLQRVAVALALVGVLVGFGRATFYLPDNPVPISFQTTGVLLIGGVLGLRWSLFAILAYYFLGMAGVPVFKDGGNGWHYVSATVTAGYIIGFVAAAPLVGYLTEHGWNRRLVLWPILLGSLIVYVPGLLWLHYFDFGWPPEGELFSKGMYPFIPGDLVKLIIASVAVGGLWTLADWRRDAKEKR
jgi:biotin transport system substrate-specific component